MNTTRILLAIILFIHVSIIQNKNGFVVAPLPRVIEGMFRVAEVVIEHTMENKLPKLTVFLERYIESHSQTHCSTYESLDTKCRDGSWFQQDPMGLIWGAYFTPRDRHEQTITLMRQKAQAQPVSSNIINLANVKIERKLPIEFKFYDVGTPRKEASYDESVCSVDANTPMTLDDKSFEAIGISPDILNKEIEGGGRTVEQLNECLYQKFAKEFLLLKSTDRPTRRERSPTLIDRQEEVD